MNATDKLLASVIICTHNRAKYLGGTIEAAAAQILPQGEFEILVVDNNSTDDTRQMVASCQHRITKVSIRYEFEGKTGLSSARNHAIGSANGQILCFLDDDAVPEANWLRYLCAAYESDDKVMCVGGAIIPEYETPPPTWFNVHFEGMFTPQIDSRQLCRVSFKKPGYPYGANLSIRSEVGRLVGLFNPKLGYNGKKLISCEETELMLRIEQMGYHILFEPRAQVRHLIPTSRLNPEYVRKRFYSQGRGYATVEILAEPKQPAPTPWHRAIILYRLIRLILYLRRRYAQKWPRHTKEFSGENFAEECSALEEIGKTEQQVVELLRTLIRRRSA